MRIIRTHKGLMKSLIKQFGQGGRLYTKQDLLQCRAKSNKSSASYKGNGAGDDHSERVRTRSLLIESLSRGKNRSCSRQVPKSSDVPLFLVYTITEQ